MAPKCKSTSSRNPLHFGASSSSDPTPSSSDAFSRRGVHSKRRVILADFTNTDLPNVIESRGWESLCDVPVTCPSVLIQEFYSKMCGLDSSVPLFHTQVQGTHIVITPELVSDVLRASKVEHPNYPGCECLRTVSKDKMISAFCECPFDWGDHKFTPCKDFAKGPRFINMVMTFFFLHPLSHYNSITEPCA